MKDIKSKNIKEFKALIERYETITINEIKEVFKKHIDLDEARVELTGFGQMNKCILCLKVESNCDDCFYGESYGCLNHKTYQRIDWANTPIKLLNAYRARAKYMKSLIDKQMNGKEKE